MIKVDCPQVQTDGWRPFCQPSWLAFFGPVFQLEQEFDRSNPYMKFGRNPIENDLVRLTTTADTASILSAILVIVRQTKPILELE